VDDSTLLALFDGALEARPEREPLQAAEAAALREVYDKGRVDALRAFADAVRMPCHLYRRADDSLVTVNDLLRETAANIEAATAPTSGIVPPHVLDKIKGHEGDAPRVTDHTDGSGA
jgi:hypothetical protein